MHFLAVGDLIERKGFRDLISAVRLSGCEVKIGGDGPQRLTLRAESHGLPIEWLGPLSRLEVREQMKRCDAFILSSHKESFGLTVCEALAEGKPVIATRCGGPDDMITNDNGLLVEPNNPAMLARAMAYMSVGVSRFAYNSDLIRANFRKRFSPEVVMQQMDEVWAKAVA